MSLMKKIEEKRRREEVQKKKANMKIAATGVTVGAIAGSLAGVLLAPKSGKETINDVKDASSKVKDTVVEKTNVTKETVSEKINESKARIKEYLRNRKEETQEDVIEVAPMLELPESVEEVETEIEETQEV